MPTILLSSVDPIRHQILAREPIFHRPAFAATGADFDRMMSADYWEIGASGRRYTRDFILKHLSAHPPLNAAEAGWQILHPQCRPLSPDTYLFTYILHQGIRRTRRATLWQQTADGWQILYHQGTLIAPDDDNT